MYLQVWIIKKIDYAIAALQKYYFRALVVMINIFPDQDAILPSTSKLVSSFGETKKLSINQ